MRAPIALLGALFGVSACGDAAAAPESPTPPPRVDGALQPLPLDTYEHSGQVVHPDIVATPFHGSPFWLAITPYPGGDATFENPSVFQSADGLDWRIPPAAANPVVLPREGYLSDPDVVYDPEDRQLRLYYRQVRDGQNLVLLARSADGVRWSAPTQLLAAPSHAIVSPAVVRASPGAAWTMWAVNSGPAGCTARQTTVDRRTSTDGIAWGAATPTDLAQSGQVVWHLDVQWVAARKEYWAVYNTYPVGRTCVTTALYLARSADGVHWTPAPSPVLSRGASDAFRDVVYRSTFSVDPAGVSVTFWFSGARFDGGTYQWRAATESWRVSDLLAATAAERAPLADEAGPLDLPPPEPADMPSSR